MLFMPKSVFEGFTIAIAATIGLKQINYACGLKGLPIHSSFTENLTESLANLHNAKAGSLLLFIPMTAALFTLIMAAPNIPWMVLIPFTHTHTHTHTHTQTHTHTPHLNIHSVIRTM